MVHCLTAAVVRITLALSKSPRLPISGSASTEPAATTRSRPPRRAANAPCRSRGSSCRGRCRPSARCSRTAAPPGRARSSITISTLPIRPASIASLSARKSGSKRRLKPIISVAPVSSTTSSRPARVRSDRSTGFSQKMALPARAKRSIRSAWVSVGVQMTTASMSPDAARSSILRTSPPSMSGVRVGRFGALGHGDERGLGLAGNGARMGLADAAGTENGEAYRHRSLSSATAHVSLLVTTKAFPPQRSFFRLTVGSASAAGSGCAPRAIIISAKRMSLAMVLPGPMPEAASRRLSGARWKRTKAPSFSSRRNGRWRRLRGRRSGA